MRNLTIRRNKTFVASLAKMRVYIEDINNPEIEINDIPCRKIGELKNGQELTVEIENTEAKVFVIADSLSKGYCNDFYQLPEGEEDIFLTGQNRYNPAAGNAFIFDGNENAEALKNRKKNKKIGIIILIIAAIVGFAIGFFGNYDVFDFKETFTFEDMSVTLTDDFVKADYEGIQAAFESEDVFILITKEEFALLEGMKDLSVEDYHDLLIKGANLEAAFETTKSGLNYFNYAAENPEVGEITYTAFLFKTDDAFWMIQFGCLTEDLPEYEEKIFDWAETIKFEK